MIGSGSDAKASCEDGDDHADVTAAVVLCVMNTKTDSSVGITFSRVYTSCVIIIVVACMQHEIRS